MCTFSLSFLGSSAMPRKSSVLLVVSLLSIIYFQSTLSKGRRNLSRMRRDTSSAALSPSFRAASFNSVQHQQLQFGGRRQASTKEDNDMWPFQWGTFVLKRFFRLYDDSIILLFVPQQRKRRRHSGRLLGRPSPIKCARRPRTVKDGGTGHYYFFSDDTNYRVRGGRRKKPQKVEPRSTRFFSTLKKGGKLWETFVPRSCGGGCAMGPPSPPPLANCKDLLSPRNAQTQR